MSGLQFRSVVRQDLAKADGERHVRPWIIVAGHRPMYSKENFCKEAKAGTDSERYSSNTNATRGYHTVCTTTVLCCRPPSIWVLPCAVCPKAYVNGVTPGLSATIHRRLLGPMTSWEGRTHQPEATHSTIDPISLIKNNWKRSLAGYLRLFIRNPACEKMAGIPW